MRKNPWLMFLVILVVLGVGFTLMVGFAASKMFGGEESAKVTAKNSILHLSLKGVIIDGKKFLKPLKKYRTDKHVKAIVIEVDSPGGVVGPSQEIYEEIKRTRTEYKLPVVVVSTSLNASGGYYASVAADKIVVAPGTLMGSIGVIMEFMNMKNLYEWAKVSRYSINTGKYKDSGAEYRDMRDDEKELFQNLINEVWVQFKDAVAEGRNLKADVVEAHADGRIMTGAQAVKLGFADQLGTVEDAYKVAADLAKLGDDYEIFEPKKSRPRLMDLINSADEDEEAYSQVGILKEISKSLRLELANKPLYLMPGSY